MVVERTAVGPGDHVLELACGTGNAAVQAAQAGATVTGLDLVPEMLDAARGRAAKAGVRLDLVEGDAEALPFADGSFDFLTMGYALRHVMDLETTFREYYRVLRPGGRFGIRRAWLEIAGA